MRCNGKGLICEFIHDESGLSAVEYGLLAAGIAVGLWSYLSGIGGSLHTIFGDVQGNLASGAAAGTPAPG